LKRPFDINLFDALKIIIYNKTESLLETLYNRYTMFNIIYII
jgi:hypothetical protein